SVKQRKLRNVVQSRKSCRGRRIPFSAKRNPASDLPASLTGIAPYPIRPLCAPATCSQVFTLLHLCSSAPTASMQQCASRQLSWKIQDYYNIECRDSRLDHIGLKLKVKCLQGRRRLETCE